MTRRQQASPNSGVRRRSDRDLWEARYTDANGRRHSVYAKTEDAVREKVTQTVRAQPAPAPTPPLTVASTWYLDNNGYPVAVPLPHPELGPAPSTEKWLPSLEERRLFYAMGWAIVVLLLAWIALTAWIVWLIR